MMKLDLKTESINSFSIIQSAEYPYIYVTLVESVDKYRMIIMKFRLDKWIDIFETIQLKSSGEKTFFDDIVPIIVDSHKGLLILYKDFIGWNPEDSYNWINERINPRIKFIIEK